MSDGKVSVVLEMEDARQVIQAACELVSVELECREVDKHDFLKQDQKADEREVRLNDLVDVLLNAIKNRQDNEK